MHKCYRNSGSNQRLFYAILLTTALLVALQGRKMVAVHTGYTAQTSTKHDENTNRDTFVVGYSSELGTQHVGTGLADCDLLTSSGDD